MRPARPTGVMLVLLALLAPGAAAARPHVAEFGMPVHTSAVAKTAAFGMRVRTAVLRPGRRFDLAGVRWSGSGELVDARVRVRVRGRWRSWVPLASADDHGPDDRPATRGSDPVWAGGADAIQLSWRSAPSGLRLSFVRVTNRVRLRAPVARASQASAPPAMVMRSQWDPGNQCRPRSGPEYGQVHAAFVHHTVTANDYAPETSPAIVLAVCRYHRNSNGWNDVGYAFLVDKYGRLFEGRAGGIDKAIVGAQAQGYNSVSTSISNLGTHTDVPQTDAALGAMADLLSWKLGVHGVPVTGQVELTSAGGSSSRYPAGRRTSFERISGHRDGGQTSCPGQSLYDQLPQLRELTAVRAGGSTGVPAPPPETGSVTLQALSTALLYPEPARLTGSISGGGQVWVQVAAGAHYRTVARTNPASDGSWAVELPLTRGHAVRALQVLPDGRHGAASPPVAITLAPVVTSATPRRVLAGRSIPVTGTVAPGQRRVGVSLWLQGRDGSFRFVRRTDLAVTDGRFRGTVRVVRPGVYRVRVRFAGTRFASASSAPDRFVRAVRRKSSLNGGSAAPAG